MVDEDKQTQDNVHLGPGRISDSDDPLERYREVLRHYADAYIVRINNQGVPTARAQVILPAAAAYLMSCSVQKQEQLMTDMSSSVQEQERLMKGMRRQSCVMLVMTAAIIILAVVQIIIALARG